MKRVLKWIAVLTFFGLIASVISYAGMRFKVGQLIGDTKREFVARSVSFGKDSIPGVGERWAWQVTWETVRLPGVRSARVWVSPTGNLIATRPANLDDRITAFQRAREP